MRKIFLAFILSIALIFGASPAGAAVVQPPSTHSYTTSTWCVSPDGARAVTTIRYKILYSGSRRVATRVRSVDFYVSPGYLKVDRFARADKHLKFSYAVINVGNRRFNVRNYDWRSQPLYLPGDVNILVRWNSYIKNFGMGGYTYYGTQSCKAGLSQARMLRS